jgi:hypothetical protein
VALVERFWETQEEFESRAGWNTEERIQEAENKESVRLEELEFSLHRAYEEATEMVEEVSDLYIEQSSDDAEISDNRYDNLGYEAVDTLIFLKKAGDTLANEIEVYLRDEREERYGESDGETLGELLEPAKAPEIEDEKERTTEIVERVENIHGRLDATPESKDLDLIAESNVDEILRENVYTELMSIYNSQEYSEEEEIGKKLASTMLDVVEMMAYLPKKSSQYFEEKQAENEERLESGEDFGVGEGGYGQTPEWVITDDISQAPSTSYLNWFNNIDKTVS